MIAQYEPPEPRSLMIDGVLLGRSKPVFSAMIVDFAVRGIVNIVDRKGKRPEAHRYAVALQQRDAAGPNEHRVLDALFQDQAKNNPVVTPSLMPSSAGAAVYSALGKAPGMATTAGLRHQPVSVWPKWVRRSSNWLLLAFVVPFGWSILHDLEPDSILGAGFLSLIGKFTVSGLSVLPWLLTESGVQRRDHLRGIRLYLTVAEQERMRILQSPEGAERVARILGEVVGPGGVNQVQVVKLNEKLLPWAVLWGVEQQWSKVLSAGYVAAGTAPNWVSTATIDSQFWRWSASNNARIAPLSTPSSGGFSWSGSGGSSSFSGSSGGGFSGGGGGGGGGGGR